MQPEREAPKANNNTQPATIYGNSEGCDKQMTTAVVPDSGSEYGDINDDDLGLDGEEGLERIDETALKAFPVAFLAFNLAYWINYIVVNAVDVKDGVTVD